MEKPKFGQQEKHEAKDNVSHILPEGRESRLVKFSDGNIFNLSKSEYGENFLDYKVYSVFDKTGYSNPEDKYRLKTEGTGVLLYENDGWGVGDEEIKEKMAVLPISREDISDSKNLNELFEISKYRLSADHINPLVGDMRSNFGYGNYSKLLNFPNLAEKLPHHYGNLTSPEFLRGFSENQIYSAEEIKSYLDEYGETFFYRFKDPLFKSKSEAIEARSYVVDRTKEEYKLSSKEILDKFKTEYEKKIEKLSGKFLGLRAHGQLCDELGEYISINSDNLDENIDKIISYLSSNYSSFDDMSLIYDYSLFWNNFYMRKTEIDKSISARPDENLDVYLGEEVIASSLSFQTNVGRENQSTEHREFIHGHQVEGEDYYEFIKFIRHKLSEKIKSIQKENLPKEFKSILINKIEDAIQLSQDKPEIVKGLERIKLSIVEESKDVNLRGFDELES